MSQSPPEQSETWLHYVTFSKDIISDKEQALEREWLVTNGIGGYASASLCGANTRRYHGLLVAALHPPLGRTVLLGKLEERVAINGKSFALDVNEWQGGSASVEGLSSLSDVTLVGTLPSFTYFNPDAPFWIQKRIWMEYGQNTTYIRYTFAWHPDTEVELEIRPLANDRDYHSSTIGSDDWEFSMEAEGSNSWRIQSREGAAVWRLMIAEQTEVSHSAKDSGWYRGFYYRQEAARGLDDTEDMYGLGTFKVTLKRGESVTFIATTENPEIVKQLYPDSAKREHDRQGGLLQKAEKLLTKTKKYHKLGDLAARLVLAADQFIVGRPDPDKPGSLLPDYRTVIAGYHWFTDWGRDTMISLPGLTLVTGRYDEAATILRTFSRFVDKGMLPNRFPDNLQAGQKLEEGEYNTVDATLWYFDAVLRYWQAAKDESIVYDLYAVLADIIKWHVDGTRFNIKVAEDGLLVSGAPGVQLTWMDVKIGDWVVTPRTGKPIEISALWYRACRVMMQFARNLDKQQEYQYYADLAEKAVAAFEKSYWNEEGQYFYDCLSFDNVPDDSLRPNQAIALAVAPDLVDLDKAQKALAKVREELLTPYGLRSLNRANPEYKPTYGGDSFTRDAAYHQGTVWGWLIGAFGTALAKLPATTTEVLPDPTPALLELLKPFLQHLNETCIGQVSEIFGAEPPYPPVGCVAQAWSVAHLLELLELLPE